MISFQVSNIVQDSGFRAQKILKEFLNPKPPTLNTENGNILVTSLLILLVMNLLGIGLANLATKEWNMANYKTIDSEVFNKAEGCSQDVITWFGTLTAKPAAATIPFINSNYITTANGVALTSELTANQIGNSDISHKLANYSYNCNVTYLTSKQATSSIKSGGEVGNSGGSYNPSGDQVQKDYYQIISTGSGPKNASKVINTIISVEY